MFLSQSTFDKTHDLKKCECIQLWCIVCINTYIYNIFFSFFIYGGVVGFCLNQLPPHGHIHAVATVSFRAQLVKNPGVTSVWMTCKRKGHLMSPDRSCYQVISDFFGYRLARSFWGEDRLH